MRRPGESVCAPTMRTADRGHVSQTPCNEGGPRRVKPAEGTETTVRLGDLGGCASSNWRLSAQPRETARSRASQQLLLVTVQSSRDSLSRARRTAVTRRTKIVATLGPASDDRAGDGSLMRAGADVSGSTSVMARWRNTSGGWTRSARRRRRRSRRRVLADLPGPKIRAGSFPEGGVDLLPWRRRTRRRRRPRARTARSPSTTPTCSTMSRSVTRSCSVTARSPCGSVVEAGASSPRSSRRSHPGRPGSAPRLRAAESAPTAEDLEARRGGGRGRRRLHRPLVRAPGDDVEAERASSGSDAQIVAKIETAAALTTSPASLRRPTP